MEEASALMFGKLTPVCFCHNNKAQKFSWVKIRKKIQKILKIIQINSKQYR